MSAKEMFEKLGYKLIVNNISNNYNFMFIQYEHKWSEYENEYVDTIKFITNEFFTESIILERLLNNYEDSLEISSRTIEAIQQQLKELRWIE